MISERPQNLLSDEQKQPQSDAQSFHQLRADQPWWLGSTFGYIITFPLIALSVGMTLLGELLLSGFHFPSAVLLVTILSISLVWGVGPGLLAMILSCLALFFFFIVPVGGLHLLPKNWELLFQVIPFALAGIVVAVITGQRERARRQALWA
ncbi:MAG TPA: DUF4118 domain-containing protein, partial [Ktedonobacteraceae bacterium]|nr:DUF4118 domain-containing protein [Ktedonobacteraceae bacterium]